ncbi:MAG: 1,6-anhydro-N-acetylmuramyl-L-alanine amidase AmpD [Pseudomonadota bacterium]|nr:1,6-anhydro-N-acetylmuramyl-L-alanine amidase AmpD [Pseudomonadota bacterium]
MNSKPWRIRPLSDRFEIDPVSGLLNETDYKSSPFCDERPSGCPPDLIVIHSISLPPGRFGGDLVTRLFTGTLQPDDPTISPETAALRVSAHLFIDRTGAVIQYVPFHARAWHAGESRYRDRARCNDFSIGIEVEGTDFEPFDIAQYRTLTGVIDALLRVYPSLSSKRIVGHCDIAPGRKTDPGPHFDWDLLHHELQHRRRQSDEAI